MGTPALPDLVPASFPIAPVLPCRQLGRRSPGRLGQKREVEMLVDAVGVILLVLMKIFHDLVKAAVMAAIKESAEKEKHP